MVTTEKLREELEKLRGRHYEGGGCESCGYGSGFVSDSYGDYVQWDGIVTVLERLESEEEE